MPTIQARHALTGPEADLSVPLTLSWEDELITQASTAPLQPDAPRRLIIPAFANAHDHARPLALSSFGAAFMPLETWLPRSMLATPPDAYLAALAPLARAARSGCGSIMVHYTRPSGKLSPVDEAREVARAARDIGVRIAYAPAIRDQNPIVYGNEASLLEGLSPEAAKIVKETYCRPPLTVDALIDMTDEIADAIAGPMVDVQYGPAAVQWCSHELLVRVAERSAQTGRRVHMHLLETPYQRHWADRSFPQGILTYLKDIGLLSPRLTLAHCIHARLDELDMIAEAGASIVTNSSSNMHLRSGIGPIAEARRRGCRIAIGMDGLAFDEDDDMVRETRIANALHGGLGFDESWNRTEFLLESVAHGRRSTGAPGTGALATGEPADFIVIDHEALDRDRIMEVDPIDLLFARATAAHIEEVVVAGRSIVKNGRVLGVDLPAAEDELRARYRQQAGRFAELDAAWPQIETALEGWFRDHAGCC